LIFYHYYKSVLKISISVKLKSNQLNSAWTLERNRVWADEISSNYDEARRNLEEAGSRVRNPANGLTSLLIPKKKHL